MWPPDSDLSWWRGCDNAHYFRASNGNHESDFSAVRTQSISAAWTSAVYPPNLWKQELKLQYSDYSVKT